MNVPIDYNDDAERLFTHPLLLPKEDKPGTMSTAEKNCIKKYDQQYFFCTKCQIRSTNTTKIKCAKNKKN